MNQTRTYSHFSDGALRSSSAITKVHVDDQDLLIVDRLIEPQTIAHFLEFCMKGVLPTGKETDLQLLTEGELPALINTVPPPAADGAVVDSRPIIERVMSRIGSMEDDDRLCGIGKNIQAVKSRLWEGIVPLSEQRWEEKGLSREENFDIACEFLSAVVAAFEYLNQAPVARNLRDTFNLIWGHWEELESLVNVRRREDGDGRPDASVTALWTEYIKAHFEVICERAHRWVLVHVEALRRPLAEAIAAHRPVDLNTVDRLQWKIMDRFHKLTEVAAVADYAIMIPMDGYKGYTTPPVPEGILPALRSPRFAERHKAYGPRLKQLTRAAQYQDLMQRRPHGGFEHHVADPESLHRLCLMQIDCQNQVRREVRGDPIEPVPKEPWIMRKVTNIESLQNTRGYGLVIYRLTYEQSQDEWASFVKKLEEHIADWGRGQTGSSAIKPHLKLHWRDGKALGIPEGDVEAAKKHYNETYSQDNVPFELQDTINQRVFLVVDQPSVASYTGTTYTAATDLVMRGDFTGFVLAVAAYYDPEEGPERPDESPGYHGQMRILGSLIWGELYAMHSAQCAVLEDLWPLALDHPNQVYVGPTVPQQIRAWRLQNGIRNVAMREMVEYVQAKLNGTPWPVQRTESTTQAPLPNPMRQNGPAAPSSEPAPPPVDPVLRNYLLRQFARDMRRRGENRVAVFAEELRRTPEGQAPDIARAMQRIQGEEDGSIPAPEAEDDGDPCAMQ